MIRALSPTLWLALALVLWGLCFQSAFAVAAEGLRSDFATATRQVQRRYGGQVIAVAPIPEAEGAVKVKVLLDDGRVKTLVVDAQSGEILDTRGSAPLMRILIVEDDPTLANQLRGHLQQEGLVVEHASDGREGLYMAQELPYDAAIVDLGLPELDGLGLIKALREAENRVPVLILTARDGWQDKVLGLEAGADDYLTKPFHFEELVARLRALVRRASGHASAVLRHGPLELDTTAKDLRVGGTRVTLTAYEYNLLEYMMLHPSKVISKTELTEHLYAQDFERDSNVIEVFVGRLRRKLDPLAGTSTITTVRGQGYRLLAAEG